MASMHFDMAELDEFAADLERVPQELSRHAMPVLKRYAQDVKNAQQEDFRESSNQAIRGIAGKVSYDDISEGAGGYETEVGIDKGSHGNLANIAIFGTWKGGGTHMHPSFHAMENYDAYVKALGDMAEEILS